ncbi:hypothetical protein COCC4DRAFT_170205 [Bipolaris maydis ATCC 48331]|uniref:Uncharacterized protein n=2 Tax=Cochliobolus heterostrophus TaxID=5016 RepID=M2U2X1_COCH5|nr:uncharacterized protein COCC4DRAFT_170205 [Bipolaris maydis ATCC 48331]EMD92844.1 hypothetical protein COCHEDRAFT_1193214 [Bipolaris maydis C5]KAJ5026077.1 hypothetical protein J3E73DRAFT_382101 [Bipolaris maydis]ENI04767.1 hypothetical protein COCC4DRAFT_170205 [Bipolaris maydis ATCC 48331]KAJ5056614.1 hypothetical protein J3E74DRAFT_279320 [Bipolaris maydis]KAJ6196206.1 hypothetical protein J3E72DRAFT_245577 [Bipolaris maydis]
MIVSGSIVALVSLLPAVWSVPTNYTNKLPTCGANECLTDGYFDGCAPGNLVCICNLEQDDVDRYVKTVQPCLDGEPGKKACTLGAVANYKQLLADVCSKPEYGNLNKTVSFEPVQFPPR